MKNTILLFCILLFGVSTSNGQDFYYYHDKKINLVDRYDHVLVKFRKNLDEEQHSRIINSISALDIKPLGQFFPYFPYQVLKLNKNNSEEVIEALMAFEDVTCSYRMYGEAGARTLSSQTNEIHVRFKNYDRTLNRAFLEQRGLQIISESDKITGLFRASVPKGASSLAIANELYETDEFMFSEPNLFYYNAQNSYDAFFNAQWHLKNSGQTGGTAGEDIKIEDAWAITTGKPTIKIAVIDDGVLTTHPDLQQNLLPGYDVTGAPYGTLHDGSHGTRVAGLIGATKDNWFGVAGVAPDCKIVPVNATLASGQTAAEGTEGILWAADPNGGDVDVINNSWSFDSPSATLESAINWAITYGRDGLGCVIVCSAGNDHDAQLNFPAVLSNVIAVGAFDNNGVKPDYSCYGSGLDISAPGGDGDNPDIATTTYDGQCGPFNGNSASTPIVSGVAALCLSVNPCLTSSEISRIIKLSARKNGAVYCGTDMDNITNANFGSGKLNAANAVRLAKYYDNLIEINAPTVTQIASNAATILTDACAVSDGIYVCNIFSVTKTVVDHHPSASYVVFSNGVNSSVSVNPANGTLTVAAAAFYNSTVGQWMPSPPQDVRFWVLPYYNPSDIFLQNRTENNFTGEFKTPGSIYAGVNVTNVVPQGNYKLNAQNNVKLIAKNAIFLQPGFETATGNYMEATIARYNDCQHFPEGIEKPSGNKDTAVALQHPQINKAEQALANSEFEIYPNPTGNEVHLDLKHNLNARVDILSVDGRVLQTVYLSSLKNIISLRKFSDGTYYLRIVNGGDVATKKIVKITN